MPFQFSPFEIQLPSLISRIKNQDVIKKYIDKTKPPLGTTARKACRVDPCNSSKPSKPFRYSSSQPHSAYF